MKIVWVTAISFLVLGCGLEEGNYKKHRDNTTSLAITNAEGEQDVLRTGTALNVAMSQELQLKAHTVYRVVVKNLSNQQEIARAELLADSLGLVELATVAHDIGENDGVGERDTLQVRVEDLNGSGILETEIPLTPHVHLFSGHGFQVDEVQPPHVYSADSNGTPLNAYVVGALPDPGEVAAPIYVAGKGFPPATTLVDIYLVRDRDLWKGRAVPRPGESDYVAGPVVGKVEYGVLKPTAVEWRPTGQDLGPYDVLVDVDRNGTFDYSFSAKDGSDGENKVGFTIQYSARWFRAKSAATAAKLSVEAAQAASTAADAAASQAEAAATNGGTTAQQLAQQARAEANSAKAQLEAAKAARGKAEAAFNQSLADDVVAQSEAQKADAAAKSAAASAQKAGQLVGQVQAAAAAYKAAVAAEMSAKHLLVNLAFDSRERSGNWKNTYASTSKIFSYVNPPVQKGERHAFVTKLVVYHQPWSTFWNNPDLLVAKRIYIADKVVQATGGTVQKSCTNSPPVAIIDPIDLPLDKAKFDVVFDYGNDGYYDVGVDLLDVVGHTESGDLVSPADLSKLSDAQIFGFQVLKQ